MKIDPRKSLEKVDAAIAAAVDDPDADELPESLRRSPPRV